mmetsp:Transcript_69415/g.165405  ORF Transcript_69415/g.165405 Transcript_69415/m.165405 type:complete len:207 (+) Transcript_69415:383-1003(+)
MHFLKRIENRLLVDRKVSLSSGELLVEGREAPHQRSEAVQEHQKQAAAVTENPKGQTQVAGGRQDERAELHHQCEGEVGSDELLAAPRKVEGLDKAQKHPTSTPDHHIRGIRGKLQPCSDGDPHVGGSERRSIVQPVSNHRNHLAAPFHHQGFAQARAPFQVHRSGPGLLPRLHPVLLGRRRKFRQPFLNAQLLAHHVRRLVLIAG